MPPESRERFAVMGICVFLYLLVLVIVVHPAAPTNHIDGVVIEQFELAVQFRDIVAGGRAGVEYLVPETAEEAEDMPCPL